MKRLAPLLLPLAACGGQPDAGPKDLIECALGGAAAFERTCTVERTPGRDSVFTIRNPGGGFRRIVATRDGRGVEAADGAEAAAVKVIGPNLIEVSLGADRYRLPARVR